MRALLHVCTREPTQRQRLAAGLLTILWAIDSRKGLGDQTIDSHLPIKPTQPSINPYCGAIPLDLRRSLIVALPIGGVIV